MLGAQGKRAGPIRGGPFRFAGSLQHPDMSGLDNANIPPQPRLKRDYGPRRYSFGLVHTRNGQSLHMLKPG
jgi:hypothetical protein